MEFLVVIPAKAGIQESRVGGGTNLLRADARSWIPAFAGMTILKK
jgi:hypothetical protein